jgi:iron(III)-salmochelin esterase
VKPLLGRRELLLGAAAVALSGCRRRPPPPPSRSGAATTSGTEVAISPSGGAWREISFAASADAPEGGLARLLVPETAADAPIVVALHGRGEAGRGLDVGAHAWPEDYALARMHRRLLAPPLTSFDLQEMTSPARLAELNASLAAAPYRGMVVACPATPDLTGRSPDEARPFGRFLTEELVARARAESGSKVERRAIGIDGVSMGGRAALFLGLSFPEVFGVVGAMQPALRDTEPPLVVALARAAAARATQVIRLVSSEDDPFLAVTRATSAALREAGITHDLLVVPGNHGYEWNRGPGSAELLLWHERVQRGLRAP